MQRPMQITFRNLSASSTLDEDIRRRAAKLEAVCPDILACRVLVELPHRHHRSGSRCHVRIEVDVPGATLVVSHEPSGERQRARFDGQVRKASEPQVAHRVAAVAVRDAFVSARERLRAYVDGRRSGMKQFSESVRAEWSSSSALAVGPLEPLEETAE